MSYKATSSILSLEVIRRMLNTQDNISQTKRRDISLGYNVFHLREILISGIKGC